MKPDLTPARPQGFLLTGHLNVLHCISTAGLKGKRLSKKRMKKKQVPAVREDPCQDENEGREDPPPPIHYPTDCKNVMNLQTKL